MIALCRLLAAALLATTSAAWAQEPPADPPGAALRVFLDCHAFCDTDFFRREINFVHWMRDRQDAEVHLILTSQGTGGGGQRFTLKYIGLRAFVGIEEELTFATRQSDTFDEIRAQLAQRMGLGLARYVARSALAGYVRLGLAAPEAGVPPAAQDARDPWNHWVFTVGVNGNVSGESQSSRNNLGGNLRARRITEDWKFETRFGASRNKGRFVLDDGEVFRSKTSRYTWSGRLARSIGDHWALGINTAVGRSSVENYDLLVRLAPGLEFDIYPYRESSRREIVLVYEVGVAYGDYTEETVYAKLRETRPHHSFTVAAEAVAPWGNIDASLVGSAYLDDWSQNRLTAAGGIEVRLVRGLDLNLFASYSRVRDQLSLASEAATDEERLLQLKQLQTDYRYRISVGLSYTFGSKFNNIVNPRYTSGIDAFDFYF